MPKVTLSIKNKICIAIILVIYFTIAYLVMGYYNITCVFLELFGIPCPGCGMTRALVALTRFDFYSAIKYNVVIFFMPYVFIYIFFDYKHKIHNILLCLIAVVAVVNWIIKIIL